MTPLGNDLGSSQSLVAVREIKQNTLVLEDGSLRKIIMVSGVNFSLKSEKEQEIITVAYQDFLNALDFPIEIVIHSRKINVSGYLEGLDKRREKERSPLLQNQINEYKEFIRQFVQENAIMAKTFLVIIPWYPAAIASQAKHALGIFSFLKKGGVKKPGGKSGEEEKEGGEEKKGAPEVQKPQDISQELPQLDQRVDQVAQGLFAVGLETVVLNDEQLAELLYNFYNPEATERESITLPQEGEGE